MINDICDMKTIDVDAEKQEQVEYERVIRQQNKIKKEFSYLTTCNAKEFQAKFVLAQAKEVCKLLYRLKFTPFRTIDSAIREMLEDPNKDLLHQLHIIKNEFEEYVPDEERISKLILEEPDLEEFPEERR